jgi:hypothetical protein
MSVTAQLSYALSSELLGSARNWVIMLGSTSRVLPAEWHLSSGYTILLLFD